MREEGYSFGLELVWSGLIGDVEEAKGIEAIGKGVRESGFHRR